MRIMCCIVYNVSFYVRGRGWENINPCFSLIKELNEMNDVNTMYMYALNFTAFL